MHCIINTEIIRVCYAVCAFFSLSLSVCCFIQFVRIMSIKISVQAFASVSFMIYLFPMDFCTKENVFFFAWKCICLVFISDFEMNNRVQSIQSHAQSKEIWISLSNDRIQIYSFVLKQHIQHKSQNISKNFASRIVNNHFNRSIKWSLKAKHSAEHPQVLAYHQPTFSWIRIRQSPIENFLKN